MPPPSKLTIATSSVTRLLKEERSYHREQESQSERIRKLEGETGEDEGGNREFMIKQERQSLAETSAIFGPLRKRIADAVAALEAQLTQDQASAPTEEVEKAKGVLNDAKAEAL